MASYTRPVGRADDTVVMVLLFLIALWPLNGISQSASNPAKEERRVQRATLSTCSFARGQVFLISSTTTWGQLGWLLCVDTDAKRSWLYRIPWVVELQMTEEPSSTSIKLKSNKLPDGSTYILSVTITGTEIQGSLIVRPDSSAPDGQSYLIQGFRLSPPSEAVPDFPAGRYSNSRYIEESGDAVGAELVLFLTKHQLAGLIKFNESYWDEPVFVPLSLSNIRIVSDQKLEFDLKLEDNNVGTYVALRRKRAIILRRLDVPSNPEAPPIILARQATLLPSTISHD